jgi:hypothetical protein
VPLIGSKQTMIDRAWALLDVGRVEACAALHEFLPSKGAEAMLDNDCVDEPMKGPFLDDQRSKRRRSE